MELRKLEIGTMSGEELLQIMDMEENCGLEPFTLEMIICSLVEMDTWCVEIDGRIAAFITVSPDSGYLGGSLYIVNLNVSPGHRRKGLATFLIKETAKLYDDEYMTLDVHRDNDKALNLYAKLGFRETDEPSVNGEGDMVLAASIADLLE